MSTTERIVSYLERNPDIGRFLYMDDGQCFNIPIVKPHTAEPAAWIRVGAKPHSKEGSINEVKLYSKEPTSYPFWEPEDNPELTFNELADIGVTAKDMHSSVVKTLSDIVKARKKPSEK